MGNVASSLVDSKTANRPNGAATTNGGSKTFSAHGGHRHCTGVGRSDLKPGSFEDIHKFACEIFPCTFDGVRMGGTYYFCPYAKIVSKATCDVLSPDKKPPSNCSLVFDLRTCGSPVHCCDDELTYNMNHCKDPLTIRNFRRHIKARVVTDPLEYFPAVNAVQLKCGAVEWVGRGFVIGGIARNLCLGDTKKAKQVKEESVFKNHQELGVQGMLSLSQTFAVGLEVVGHLNDQISMPNKPNAPACARLGARLALPDNSAIVSLLVGKGDTRFDMVISLSPLVTLGLSHQSSFPNLDNNIAKIGLRFKVPEEETTVKIAFDNKWQAMGTIEKKISHRLIPVPVMVKASLHFDAKSINNNANLKAGIGIELAP